MSYAAKKDYLQLFDKLTAPLKDCLSIYGFKLGSSAACYSDKTAQAEGFLRMLWGLVPVVAGSGGYDEWIKIYNEHFERCTDSSLEDYWGDCGTGDQLFVEMTPIAYAILFAPDKFWEPLSAEAKDDLAAWMYSINEHDIPLNNWQMFRVLVNTALKSVGKRCSNERIEEAFAHIESNYLGDGWYTDGHTCRCDYYISFAIHFYCLLYVASMEKDDPKRCAVFRARAGRFAKDFIYWFSRGGEAVPYGRSLIYRFAQVSFWSACLIADVKPFSYGVIKGIISRHMDEWMKRPIFDNAGILNIGYYYSNMFMTENYNSPGSPYWCFKMFAMLMLPEDHPFWKASIEPLPELDEVKTIKKAKMVITRTDDNVCMFVPGLEMPSNVGQDECKYSKFVYSSKYGFSVSRGSQNIRCNVPDSMLSFLINSFVFVRREVKNCRIENDTVYSEWSPFKGITVETTVIPSPRGHIRKHRIMSEYECEAYDSGFALEIDDLISSSELGQSAEVSNKTGYCRVSGRGGEGRIINAFPNTDLLYNRTMIPTVKYKISKGITEIVTNIEYDQAEACFKYTSDKSSSTTKQREDL